MNHIETTFTSHHVSLPIRIDLAPQSDSRVIIYLPGISGGALEAKTDYLAKGMTEAGFHLVRFQFRYHQDKENFETYCIDDSMEDIVSVVTFLRENEYNIERYGIIGKSFGGLLSFLREDSRIWAIGLLAPALFASEASTISLLRSTPYSEIPSVSEINVDTSSLQSNKIPKFLIHGDTDESR